MNNVAIQQQFAHHAVSDTERESEDAHRSANCFI
jgi:hypothetical protein